jgi:predicted secreted protein
MGGLLLTLDWWCIGCARGAKMVEIDRSYDGREVELGVGDVVKLNLAENPTTGYRWAFTAQPEPACKIVSDTFESGRDAPGAGGTHRWQFQAVSSGTGSVELQYRRAWEKDSSAGQTFKLTIRVR